MLVPITWLKEYTDIEEDAVAFAERMILSGSNIETVKTFGEDVMGVVIGRVLSVERHADSDHLLICRVDVGTAAGGDAIQIVTGAPNVSPGIVAPVALHGAVLPGGVKIRRGKLRGVMSEGMLCSAEELGFDDKVTPLSGKNGIWILPDEFEVGADASEALGLRETVVDFEITPNRPDCLSILGMAREAAAVFGGALRYPNAKADADGGKAASDFIKVEIARPDLCGRYVARIAEQIVVRESPWWLQRRLMFAGMRPINNIVDITNYVMLEYGHPIHAFDVRTIAGGVIIVDTAKDGETFVTLDNTVRTLSGDMLLINDREKGVGIAGVMGGLNSEIETDTETILVEAANFNSASIRRTSKALGIRSEASSRFEKGVSAELSGAAADRVCALIAETGAGRIVGGAVDNYPGKAERKPVSVRVARVNALLGTALARNEMANMLKRLEMEVAAAENVLRVIPPHVRVDLCEEVDFIEEIGRMYGYDRLGVTLHKDSVEAEQSRSWRLRELARDVLTGAGLCEIQTYSFVSPGGVDRIALPPDSDRRNFVRLINPLGEENSVMRTALLPNMLDILSGNFSRSNAAVRLFEIGNTFLNAERDALPKERISLSIGGYGSWGFFELKGVIETLLERFGIGGATFESVSDTGTYHPGRCARISIPHADAGGSEAVCRSGQPKTEAGAQPGEVGLMGEIHPDVRAAFDIGTEAWGAEIDLEYLIGRANPVRRYTPLERYPAVVRDVSLLTADEVTVGAVERIIRRTGGKLLEQVRLFDVYRGKQIPEGMKSLSFSLTYRASDRTLTDEEVAKTHEKILGAIAENTGAGLREI
ncbi:MAG: phenylalanine--tRNA ligase subunit beta [Clostridiales Family XIII bacterium]|jgi:phenylalanyl-tRNA synthetase beta chain|nr:phenylalanine--tRNA ligase subunit beta [Clostridiales Family XIII bacterium]